MPDPIPYAELDPCKRWPAGQPVTLISQGVPHTAFVRLTGFTFGPRWLAGSIRERRLSPSELSLRDPRQVWADSYELQLAQALLSAEGDDRCAWLRDIDEEAEPELFDLLLLAREELARRPAPVHPPGAAPSPEPKPRRGWTIEALRMPEGAVEPVDLAPGR